MQGLSAVHVAAKRRYDAGQCPTDLVGQAAAYAIAKLGSTAKAQPQAKKYGKDYWVFKSGRVLSRPYLPSLFIDDPTEFSKRWAAIEKAIDPKKHTIGKLYREVDSVLYSAITAYSVCFDLWNASARKTPGTFFEILFGSLTGRILPEYERTKFIAIPNQIESVSTDIVFKARKNRDRGLVFPVKITTRERIVQPFAHQRILDSVFGAGAYRSVLICASELQRDKEEDINEICVPGTIRLFQAHLAPLTGIYYLDPPSRYLQTDITEMVPVGSVGQLLTTILPTLL